MEEKKKFEHLFSQDPIGAFEKIKQDYVRYFEAAFKIDKDAYKNGDKCLDDERIDLLKVDNNMSKEPYLELLPEYSPASGLKTIQDLIDKFASSFGSETLAKQYFEDFIAKGLMRNLLADKNPYIPYGHQIGMLEKAFAGIDEKRNPLKYKNTVITSGTGSGKTESFLLPLLADIFKEAISWGQAKDHSKWFVGEPFGRKGKTRYSPKQREGDSRPAAVRALVLYPMNALVEDQMARLREALDSNDVRTFMDNSFKGNRIYFGGYNGSTIAKKNYKLLEKWVDDASDEKEKSKRKTIFNNKREEVAQKLFEIHKEHNKILGFLECGAIKKDALYISPRIGGDDGVTGEMVTRWDMQEWAPDIMITNTSMLSIMLMREAEAPIFEQTRKWLAAEDLPEDQREEARKDRIFHIIVDELHLYRGTAGSEVACLLRMLYNAIGLSPVIDEKNEKGEITGNKIPNPQIKILASSASLGNEDQTQKFMEEFFGVYSTIESERVFNVQPGTDYIDTLNEIGDSIDYTKFSFFTHENFVAIDKDIDKEKDEQEKQRLLKQVFETRLNVANDFVKKHFSSKDIIDFVKTHQSRIFYDFYKVMPENKDGDPKKGMKPSIRPLSLSKLSETLFGNDEKALRGFLIFRGFIDEIPELKNKHKLPRFRFHKFFKYIEGLWGELNPDSNNGAPVANLSYKSKEVGPNNRKVLELLRCENCGQLFIGGNRKKDDDYITLTLNYPNLEQIPNFNPTPMVQNKNYRDYAIFWPQKTDTIIKLDDGEVRQGAEDHVVEIGTGKKDYPLGKVSWISGYLDSYTGRFTSNNHLQSDDKEKENLKKYGIKGYLYCINNYNTNNEIDDIQASRIYATPCTCPHCRQNYTLRKYTNSPIRSFRTGIDRSNQILSKELLYQLDEKSAKLIGFSDSREDAAKQALGIEREHYRDMVRMLFVECVNETESIVSDIKQYLEKRKKQEPEIDNEDLLDEIEGIFRQTDAKDIADAILYGKKKILAKYGSSIIPISDLVDKDVFRGTLVKKLLDKGINPAGEAYKFQWYKEIGNDTPRHWSDAYDFEECRLKEDTKFAAGDKYKEQIITQLENAIFANSFGKYMGVSVLDAGIGYICGPQSDTIKQSKEYKDLRDLLPQHIDVYEFVDAFIRVMGDNYYYPSNEGEIKTDSYGNLKGVVKRPIREFCEKKGIDETKLGNLLVAYLHKNCTDPNLLYLNLSKLSFAKMTKDRYIICEHCGRVHPNMGFGFCTNTSCMKPLDPDKTVSADELHKHYISFDILKEKKEPKRLHTEELSGQTDDIQSRLREFKDLILDEDPAKKLTLPIDMICVTTTMEVGVDIGSLQAIYQGNMPPTRYNYQQRVGRGGRRGQAFSAAFTFCRGRSHDVYYYDKATDEMVGGIPATPTLSLAPYKEKDGSVKMKMAIMKRVIVKEVLHMAYLGKLPFNYYLQDTAGEFGSVGEWSENQSILKEWINKNGEVIENIVHRYFDQFNKDNQINNDIVGIINWIKNEDTGLLGQIDRVVMKTTNYGMGLAEYLSESGFLPMYGLPSDSRYFYHGFDTFYKKVKSIDRSSEMAITEFAPGAEKTKDKGKYRVEGLTIPMKEEADSQGNLTFYDTNGDALSDRYILTFIKNADNPDNNIKEISEAPKDVQAKDIQLNETQKLIVIPQAYRSIDIKGNFGTPIENNDRGSSFTQSVIYARDNSQVDEKITKKEVCNVDISLYELGLNEDPTVWHVNSNNGKFYSGSYTRLPQPPTGTNSNFMFYEKHAQDSISSVDNGMKIALGAKKVTEMVKLELKKYPNTLNLSLESGNKSAIRAAFYSAAFLLQRALADKLDVQPDEIEICEKIDEEHEYPSIYLSDALPNGAGIVSYLYQDGNLENLIKRIVDFDTFDPFKTSKDESFMQSLISEDHRDTCLTACQKCLLAYNNRGFHHVLDWRLGVGILRLMINPDYDFGYTVSDRNKYEELKDWDNILAACAKKLFLTQTSSGQNLWKKNGNSTIIYHPLWKKEKLFEDLSISPDTATMYNSFKVLRSDLTNDGEMNPNIIKKNKPAFKKKKKTKNDTETPPDQTSQDDNLVL